MPGMCMPVYFGFCWFGVWCVGHLEFVKRKREENMKAIALTTLAAAAGLATASPFLASGLTNTGVGTAGSATSSMTIDISGFNSWDLQGAVVNETLSMFVGNNAVITGIAWDVSLSTFNMSWASEAVMDFEGQIFLTVGASDDFPVTNANYNSGGVLDLTDAGVPNIVVGADGILDINFFEGFDDVAGEIDATYLAGSTITIVGQGIVPAPASLALIGLGGLAAGRRRR
jgi:hypothetical protein